jgi:thymidylate kinase
MAWYVIEGPDQTGKTTLALRLLQDKGHRYLKATEADVLPVLALRMAALINEENVVWDRAHLSEAVHHPDRVDQEWFQLIEQLLHQKGAVCVLLTDRRGIGPFENDAATHLHLVDAFFERSAWSALQWHGRLEVS